MVSVVKVKLPTENPIVGCELTPYVALRFPSNKTITHDVAETVPIDGHCLAYKWYRIQSDNSIIFCSVHQNEHASLQCVACLKLKVPVSRSYFCSGKCFADAWLHHRALHVCAASPSNENTTAIKNSGETWFEVGRFKTYTPSADDVGHTLKFECVVIDVETKLPVGPPSQTSTSHVIAAPSPVPRRLIPVSVQDFPGHLDSNGHRLSVGTFSVLSYNILADAYATREAYSHCPHWALSWPYRRQKLLHEIVGYYADIVCLQEVQSDHFEDFLSPELDKHGYQAIYKRRTSEASQPLDGCATFFRRDRFSFVRKYEVDFNKAARTFTEAVFPIPQRKNAWNRLCKDNVALLVVLEAKFALQGADNPGKQQLLCVANTHLNVHQEFNDVNLWQVHTLLKGLESLAAKAGSMPLILCGDFCSAPGSSTHSLIVMGKVDSFHPDLSVDILGISRPPTKLSHELTLVSAYSSFAVGLGPAVEEQRKRIDPSTNEPFFTNCTRDFVGTHDYIFYTADSLVVESLLELLDKDSLRRYTGLPSPEWPSDHIALLAEFSWKRRTRWQ